MAILALGLVIFLYYVAVGVITEARKQHQTRKKENEKLEFEVAQLMAEDKELESHFQLKKVL